MFIDRKFALILGNRLDGFVLKSDGGRFLAEFRCPICGDSRKSKTKKRGYLYDGIDHISLVYKCHNCGISCSFDHFLEMVDVGLYKEYKFEKIKLAVETKSDFHDELKAKIKIERHVEILDKLIPVTTLTNNHECIEYIKNRKIPVDQWHRLYYVDNFMRLVNEYKPGKHRDIESDPRLVLPFFTSDGSDVFMLQGRTLGNSKARYLSLRLDNGKGMLYGLEKVQKNKDIYVTEGPIDSLFLPNSVAMATSAVDVTKHLPKERIILVMDNEPRNRHIVKLIERAIERGLRVVIWPEWIEDKDINMMAISGLNYVDIIQGNTYHGLQARLKLAEWRKV